MAEKDSIINFTTEDGDTASFKVIEQTRLNGCNYLLVYDMIEEEEEEALILKETSPEGQTEAVYEIVDNDRELSALAKVFEELLDDVELVPEDN